MKGAGRKGELEVREREVEGSGAGRKDTWRRMEKSWKGAGGRERVWREGKLEWKGAGGELKGKEVDLEGTVGDLECRGEELWRKGLLERKKRWKGAGGVGWMRVEGEGSWKEGGEVE